MSDLTFKVQRFNPESDKKPFLQEFKVPLSKGMTLLEGLIYIKENLDNTLAFRSSCRMGICGSCAVLVNNFPRLACHTPIEELRADVLEVRSLPNFPVIRDLVADLTTLFEKHRSIKPYVIGEDTDDIQTADLGLCQSPEELEQFMQFSYCVKCGICMAACPTVATDKLFLGPQPLGQAYRYCMDHRDHGNGERLKNVDSPHGLWLCHLAGACSEACPKGVDPAFGIQLLKRQAMSAGLGIRKPHKPAPPAPAPKETKPRIEPPPFTVR